MLCLCTEVFIYFYGDLCPKYWTPQPNWPHILVYGDLCPKLWTPQPNWLDIFMYGDSCPTLWTPQPNWLDIFVFRGLYVQSCGHPSLTGLTYLCLVICVQSCGLPYLTGSTYLCTGICVQSCALPCLTSVMCLFMSIFVSNSGYLSLNGTMRLHFRDCPKVVDPSDYVVVACLLLCTVTRLCTRESFWSRIVEIINTRQIPIVICSDLL